MKRFRRRAVFLIVVLVGLLLAYSLRRPVLAAVGQWLDVGDTPSRSDYVLILNGGETTRPFVAAALIRVGLARQALVITSVPMPDQQDGLIPPTHEIIRQVLLRRGVRAEQIVVFDRNIVNTYHEAESLGVFLDAHPGARVTVVTGHFHTRRARWIFRQVLAKRAGQLQFVSAPMDEFILDRWWETSTGFQTVPAEYLRFAFYVVRYSRTARVVLAGALLLLATVALLLRRRRARRRACGPGPVVLPYRDGRAGPHADLPLGGQRGVSGSPR